MQVRLQAGWVDPDEILTSALAIGHIYPLTIPRHAGHIWAIVWVYPVISRGLLNFELILRYPDLSCQGQARSILAKADAPSTRKGRFDRRSPARTTGFYLLVL